MPALETYDTYDMSRYLMGLNDETAQSVAELACVVECEIDLGAQPFAARALDLGYQCPGSLQRYAALPPTGSRAANRMDLEEVRRDASLPDAVRRDDYMAQHLAEQRITTTAQLQHALALRTCQAASVIVESAVAAAVTLGRQPGGIRPATQIIHKLESYAVIDKRVGDYNRSLAVHAHDKGPVAKRFVQHRLLVAAAALAVHDATGKTG